MARTPRSVEEAIARFDEYSARLDGHTPAAGSVRGRYLARTAGTAARRVGAMGIAIAVLVVATIGFGLAVGPIGLNGLFVVGLATLAILLLFSFWPSADSKRVEYSEQLPTGTVVRQLETMLARRRTALPAPAAKQADAIGAQLPLLESRLAEVDSLDPLAQDARRLMGKHLPELIERYERIPAGYRQQRDGEGLTADQRLVASLDAAGKALGEIGDKLVQGDRQAFETQGRFIESRYKEDGGPGGQ
ncbi:MAG TPA: hypothetical protein VFR28_04240 [Allosphingosinicella sp.]|jgi:hypothetical protein|nr:hypothetical protein [Allosphingosinicella sp.]